MVSKLRIMARVAVTAPMTMAVGGGLAAAAATTELVLGGPDAED